MRTAGGIRCSTKRALTMMPSQPSFWMPGKPAEELVGDVLAETRLAERRAGNRQRLAYACAILPSASYHASSNVATGASWILPRLWSTRVTSSHSASGVTIRHDSRLSSAVPHSTAFLPPAFIATLPPMHDASAEVGSTANTSPAASAASITRRVTTPAAAVDRRHRTRARPGSADPLDRRQALELLGVDDRGARRRAESRRRCNRCRRRAG